MSVKKGVFKPKKPSQKKSSKLKKLQKKIPTKGKKPSKKKPTKKWREMVPMSTKKRVAKAKKAPHCFLDLSDPKRPKYPICKAGSSRISCQGLASAKKRAILQKNAVVKRRASRLEKILCK
jgi:hypothetical protein